MPGPHIPYSRGIDVYRHVSNSAVWTKKFVSLQGFFYPCPFFSRIDLWMPSIDLKYSDIVFRGLCWWICVQVDILEMARRGPFSPSGPGCWPTSVPAPILDRRTSPRSWCIRRPPSAIAVPMSPEPAAVTVGPPHSLGAGQAVIGQQIEWDQTDGDR